MIPLVPHHLLNLAVMERHPDKTPEIIAQEMIDAVRNTKIIGINYEKDVLGVPSDSSKVNLYKQNIIKTLRVFKEGPDSAKVEIRRGLLDSFCKSCTGKHDHCLTPSQVFTDLPLKNPLAKKYDAICAGENDSFTRGFYKRLQEEPNLDPKNETKFIDDLDRVIVQTTLGIVRTVLQNTAVEYWKGLSKPAVEKMKKLLEEIREYNLSQEKSA
ncbi:MAG TPA: hypothetical protein VF189_05580 [Patescibacteria group bacterium]